jgi:regulator of protease activity HflC (stomatin/prohibitin superfamily)
MNQSATSPANILPRPYRFIRRLTLLYSACTLVAALFLTTRLLSDGYAPSLRSLAAETLAGGLAAMVLCALLLTVTGLSAALLMTYARYRPAVSAPKSSWGKLSARLNPGFSARIGQAVLLPLGAVLSTAAAWWFWPISTGTAAPADGNVVVAFVFALAFVSLVAERSMHSFPEPQLPEAPALRRLLLLTTLLLLAAACIELGRGAALSWIRWPTLLIIVLPVLVLLELSVRALARLFLPSPAPAAARAATTSILATIVTGGPRAPGVLLRTHLGLDFARSWALSYLSAAILPAIGATALLCWGLSGLKLIDLGERGVYERFGAPVAVLGPGLHVLLPWPLGRLRPVEYGAIHAVAIGVDQDKQAMEADTVGAEALPPASLNRLWESTHAGQAEYLVASASTGLQGFQAVSTEISVLYRVGLTDQSAMQSVYSVAEPELLVRNAASRLVLRYFNSRTLESVLGAKRENIADALREALVADLNAHRAGIDVVSVLIEEIHPPAGAAAAYHAVQAAQINASASISNETGRAKRTAGIAQQESHQLTTASAALAEETLHAANTAAYQFNADRHAYAESGRAFLLERSNRDIIAALIQTPLTIVDHRLSAAQAPIIDLRMIGTQPQTNPAPSSPPARVVPGPSQNEGSAEPPLTPQVETDN